MRSRGARSWLGIALLAIAAGTLYLALRRPLDLTQLVRVLDGSCYDFALHLDQAVPVSGFPSVRWLRAGGAQNMFVNRDTERAAFYFPFEGEALFPNIPIHGHAQLTWQAGIEPEPSTGLPKKLPDAPRTCRFEIVLRSAGAQDRVLDSVNVSLTDAHGTLSEVRACGVPPSAGSETSIVLRTVGSAPDLLFLPTWRGPVLRSDGHRERLEKHPIERTDLIDDLLRRFEPDDATKRPVTIQRRAKGDAPIDVPAVDYVPNFDAAPILDVANGGELPSLVFARSGRVTLAPVRVPEGAELRFAFGLEGFETPLAEPAGEATLSVLAGEQRIWSKRISGQQGWDDPGPISLAGHEGDHVELAFAVELGAIAPRPIAVKTIDLESKETVAEPRELLVRRAGIARPRLVAHQRVPRRLAGEGQPNVIVLVAETLRADRLGCYGSTLGITPELDALARRSLVYERASSASSWTLASTASILTGLDPILHGAVTEDRQFLADHNETLAEAAGKLGVTTAAFTTSEFIRREWNFDQGFETFACRQYANARQLNQLFFDWLDDHRDVQFLAYLHYWDPHDPCNAPGELERKHVPEAQRGLDPAQTEGEMKALLASVSAPPLPPDKIAKMKDGIELVKGLYAGEIEYLDRHVGELLRRVEQLGLAGKTYVIFTSDHGEELLEHGWWGHGCFLHDESIHVPLLIAGPGVAPQRIAGPVENLRVYQTALLLLGDHRPEWGERGPLPPWGPAKDYAFSSTWKGIRTIQPSYSGKHLYEAQSATEKLILEIGEDPKTGEDSTPISWTRFDLSRDPGAQHGEALPSAGPKAEIERRLRIWFDYVINNSNVGPAGMSPEQFERLKALGYGKGAGGTGAGAKPASGK